MATSPSINDPWGAPAWIIISRGATLPYVWRIPLVVGTLLSLVNLTPRLLDGPTAGSMVALAVNYTMPYVVSSLGFLRCQRQTTVLKQTMGTR